MKKYIWIITNFIKIFENVGSCSLWFSSNLVLQLQDDDWSWNNAANGFMIGTRVGAVFGGAWGGIHYGLQATGEMAIKNSINNLVNNHLDECVTIGPKDGAIGNYMRSISQIGNYGKIYASKLELHIDGDEIYENITNIDYKYNSDNKLISSSDNKGNIIEYKYHDKYIQLLKYNKDNINDRLKEITSPTGNVIYETTIDNTTVLHCEPEYSSPVHCTDGSTVMLNAVLKAGKE